MRDARKPAIVYEANSKCDDDYYVYNDVKLQGLTFGRCLLSVSNKHGNASDLKVVKEYACRARAIFGILLVWRRRTDLLKLIQGCLECLRK